MKNSVYESSIAVNCNISVLNGLIMFRTGVSGRFL